MSKKVASQTAAKANAKKQAVLDELAKKEEEEEAKKAQLAEAAEEEAAEEVALEEDAAVDGELVAASDEAAASDETAEAAQTIADVAESLDRSSQELAAAVSDNPMMFAQAAAGTAGGAAAGTVAGISTTAIVAGVAVVGVAAAAGGSSSSGGVAVDASKISDPTLTLPGTLTPGTLVGAPTDTIAAATASTVTGQASLTTSGATFATGTATAVDPTKAAVGTINSSGNVLEAGTSGNDLLKVTSAQLTTLTTRADSTKLGTDVINVGAQIDGGAGTDMLIMELETAITPGTAVDALNLGRIYLKDIEVVGVKNTDAGTDGREVDTKYFGAVKELWNWGSAADKDVTFTNVQSTDTVIGVYNTTTDTAASFDTTLTGTKVTAVLDKAAAGSTLSLTTGDAVKTVEISSNGSASTVSNVLNTLTVGSKVETVKFYGDRALTVGTGAASITTTVKDVDASGMKEAFTLKMGNLATTNYSVTGGAKTTANTVEFSTTASGAIALTRITNAKITAVNAAEVDLTGSAGVDKITLTNTNTETAGTSFKGIEGVKAFETSKYLSTGTTSFKYKDLGDLSLKITGADTGDKGAFGAISTEKVRVADISSTSKGDTVVLGNVALSADAKALKLTSSGTADLTAGAITAAQTGDFTAVLATTAVTGQTSTGDITATSITSEGNLSVSMTTGKSGATVGGGALASTSGTVVVDANAASANITATTVTGEKNVSITATSKGAATASTNTFTNIKSNTGDVIIKAVGLGTSEAGGASNRFGTLTAEKTASLSIDNGNKATFIATDVTAQDGIIVAAKGGNTTVTTIGNLTAQKDIGFGYTAGSDSSLTVASAAGILSNSGTLNIQAVGGTGSQFAIGGARSALGAVTAQDVKAQGVVSVVAEVGNSTDIADAGEQSGIALGNVESVGSSSTVNLKLGTVASVSVGTIKGETGVKLDVESGRGLGKTTGNDLANNIGAVSSNLGDISVGLKLASAATDISTLNIGGLSATSGSVTLKDTSSIGASGVATLGAIVAKNDVSITSALSTDATLGATTDAITSNEGGITIAATSGANGMKFQAQNITAEKAIDIAFKGGNAGAAGAKFDAAAIQSKAAGVKAVIETGISGDIAIDSITAEAAESGISGIDLDIKVGRGSELSADGTNSGAGTTLTANSGDIKVKADIGSITGTASTVVLGAVVSTEGTVTISDTTIADAGVLYVKKAITSGFAVDAKGDVNVAATLGAGATLKFDAAAAAVAGALKSSSGNVTLKVVTGSAGADNTTGVILGDNVTGAAIEASKKATVDIQTTLGSGNSAYVSIGALDAGGGTNGHLIKGETVDLTFKGAGSGVFGATAGTAVMLEATASTGKADPVITSTLSGSASVHLALKSAEGNKTLIDASKLTAALKITGTNALSNDSILGGSGNDTIDGGAGDDTIVLLGGSNTVNGLGVGADTVKVTGGLSGQTNTLTVTSTGTVSVEVTGGSDRKTTVGASASTVVATIDASKSTVGVILNNAQTDGTSGASTITGGAGADSIKGGDADESLVGGAGNDTIISGGGADTIVGGAGDNVFVYQGGSTAVTGYLDTGTGSNTVLITRTHASNSETITFVDLEEATTNKVSEIRIVQADTRAVAGGVTGVTFSGKQMNGADLDINGTAVAHTLTVTGETATANTIDLSKVTFRTGITTTNLGTTTGGTVAGVSVTGGSADDRIIGTAGGDTINGSGGADTLTGGAGNDVYQFATASTANIVEVANGGTADRIVLSAAADMSGLKINGSVAALSSGTAGLGIEEIVIKTEATFVAAHLAGTKIKINETSAGDATTLNITGATGTQSFADLDFATVIVTGGDFTSGTDLVKITLANTGTNVITGTTIAASITGGNGSDTITGGAGADTLVGGSGNDSLVGGAGIDIINGGEGNDTIVGGEGADSLNGGDGDDLFVFASQAELLADTTVIGGTGTDTLRVDGQLNILTATDFATVATVERLVQNHVGAASIVMNDDEHLGSLREFDISASTDNSTMTFTSSETAVLLRGGSGSDAITGDIGADTIYGGDGADTITGAGGADIIDAGAGDDTLIYLLDDDLFTSGNQAEDSIIGGDGTDRLLVGTSGTAFAVAATDSWARISSIETLQSVANAAAVTIELNANSYTAGLRTVNISAAGTVTDHEIDASLVTGGGMTLIGAASATTITGGTGADTITGGVGADTIIGGAGDDSITGGAGADTFVVAAQTSGGIDTITDFAFGTDFIKTGITQTTAALTDVSATNLSASVDLQAAAAAAVAAALVATGTTANWDTAGDTVLFNYGTRSYLVSNAAADALYTTADILVDITGYTGTAAIGSIIA